MLSMGSSRRRLSQKHSSYPNCKYSQPIMPFPEFVQEINDIISSHCATSPMAQHNQIAVACRTTNMLWRRMHRKMLQFLLNKMIKYHDALPIPPGHLFRSREQLAIARGNGYIMNIEKANGDRYQRDR